MRAVEQTVGRIDMANKLQAIQLNRPMEPGRYCDGNNLYLHVSNTGAKSWEFRYAFLGKTRYMGLGPFSLVSLAEARSKAIDAKKLLLEGKDPLELKHSAKRTAAIERAKTVTFDQCAQEFISDREATWKNAKHRQQWRNTIAADVSPIIGSFPVQSIDTTLVLRVLQPIWKTKTETADRIRGRIEQILDYATSRELRTGENPARWKGHLEHTLAAPSSVSPVQHHRALPYDEIPDFMKELRSTPGVGARALEFTILTAVRTGEARSAQWSEFDLSAQLWTIPARRMKAGKEHRVPLSPRVLELLAEMKNLAQSDYVFPGRKPLQPISDMTMTKVLRSMNKDVTTHGFRSSFRDWIAELTAFENEAAEKALAHTVKNKVEAAYRRGDMLAKRVPMMNEWANFCSGYRGSNVVTLSPTSAAV